MLTKDEILKGRDLTQTVEEMKKFNAKRKFRAAAGAVRAVPCRVSFPVLVVGVVLGLGCMCVPRRGACFCPWRPPTNNMT